MDGDIVVSQSGQLLGVNRFDQVIGFSPSQLMEQQGREIVQGFSDAIQPGYLPDPNCPRVWSILRRSAARLVHDFMPSTPDNYVSPRRAARRRHSKKVSK